ncbi:MAG: putative DNA binding domain-containing protein [Flavobacteriales bacterium]|nr:putative DNA binding domain-containing protein [Flavobacteriales bacterium]
MRYLDLELLEKIRLGEDSGIECKEIRLSGERLTGPRPDDLADEIAAFANKRGGVLLLGVDDKTKEVIGIPYDKLEAVERTVKDICQSKLKPALETVDIYRRELPDSTGQSRAIIQVEITRSLFLHDSPGGTYTRVGSSKRQMSQELKMRMQMQRSQSRVIRFDEFLVHEAGLKDLDKDLYDRFRTERSDTSVEDYLRKLGILGQDEEGEWHPTLSGVLMCSKSPETWHKGAFIQAVAYAGADVVPAEGEGDYQLDAEDITGPLDHQVVGAMQFVRRNSKVAATKEAGRTDKPEYDTTAIFEALVNAVVHRDYTIQGSKVRLHMFSNRLELFVPGTLVNTLELDSIGFRQVSRNDTLASLLSKVPVDERIGGATTRSTYMDRRGEGAQIIVKRTLQLAGQPATYQLLGDDELMLTIPKAVA